MPEIGKAELRRLRRAAAYGVQARKREALLQKLREQNRGRKRTEVQGIGPNTEREFRKQAAAAGWDASKRGWPDFILRRDNDIAFVEVKSYAETALKPEQQAVAELLAAAGFKVYRWSPDGGFTRILVAPRTEQTPGGSDPTTEPATRGTKHSRRPTPIRDGELQQLGTASGTHRVGQGTRTPQGCAGPRIEFKRQRGRQGDRSCGIPQVQAAGAYPVPPEPLRSL